MIFSYWKSGYESTVGQGFDVHALVENRPLIIGGVHIPYTHGLAGIRMRMCYCMRLPMRF